MVSITNLYQAEMGTRWHYLQSAVLQSTKECLTFEGQGLQCCFQSSSANLLLTAFLLIVSLKLDPFLGLDTGLVMMLDLGDLRNCIGIRNQFCGCISTRYHYMHPRRTRIKRVLYFFPG